MTLYRTILNKKVVREATYDQLTHFLAADKYVTAHCCDGQELLLDITLKQLKADHPELVFIHRSALVKPELISVLRRDPGAAAYYITMANGQTQWVSRRCYPQVRDLMSARKELAA